MIYPSVVGVCFGRSVHFPNGRPPIFLEFPDCDPENARQAFVSAGDGSLSFSDWRSVASGWRCQGSIMVGGRPIRFELVSYIIPPLAAQIYAGEAPVDDHMRVAVKSMQERRRPCRRYSGTANQKQGHRHDFVLEELTRLFSRSAPAVVDDMVSAVIAA